MQLNVTALLRRLMSYPRSADALQREYEATHSKSLAQVRIQAMNKYYKFDSVARAKRREALMRLTVEAYDRYRRYETDLRMIESLI